MPNSFFALAVTTSDLLSFSILFFISSISFFNSLAVVFWISIARNDSSILTNKQEDTTKAMEEEHFVRDGIKFKSRQDLEAYIDSQRVADPFK